jgi:hypothetical protein
LALTSKAILNGVVFLFICGGAAIVFKSPALRELLKVSKPVWSRWKPSRMLCSRLSAWVGG